MKKFYTLALVLLCTFVGKAQIINIPDAAFKAKLLSASPTNQIASTQTPYYIQYYDSWSVNSYDKIDTNNDGEIQVSEALAIKFLDVSGTYYVNGTIVNMTGVESFLNLLVLKCNYNVITTLNVSGSINLHDLECNNNQLPSLNVSGLIELQILCCENNQLPSLNVSGLTNLEYLKCEFNQLPSLNVSGLTNLTRLICNSNQLSSLNVSGLTNLGLLDCRYNQLPSIDVSSLTNLQYLYCDDNQLPSLNVSSLTILQSLSCSDNQLPGLNVSGLTNLKFLDCRYNQLPSIDLSSLTNLQSLSCDNNQLPSLNLSGLTNLKILSCSNNQIHSLDVSDSAILTQLTCPNNQLSTLLMKNGSNETFFDFSGNPNLHYICADNFQFADIQNAITLSGYVNCQVNSYCSFTPGGTFYTIQGNSKYDINNNGCGANDVFIPNLKLAFSDGTNSGNLISNVTGNYTLPVLVGTHTFSPVLEKISYFNVSPTSATVTFPTTASPFVQDFCVTANGSHPDLEVIIMPINRARPGFDADYKLVYKNKGNQTQSGSVNLTFNEAVLDLVSANPAVTTQVLNALSWNFSNMHPFETREIVFTLNVNAPTETPAVNGGDVLNYVTTISSTATETTPSDNTFAYNQTVVNAFDPNEKVCLEGNTIAPAKVGDFVHYLIRFENDGTANAQNIVVKDMIDTTKFDIATLIPESGSATYTTRITNTNQAEFVFQNINLPFTAGTNTGYVAFKIKTKPTLVLGNTFSNTASIYFDYNFPIITNTATTTVQALATQDFEFNNYFTLYPNPAKNVLNISTKSTIEVHSMTIYNLLGQVILAIPNAQNMNTIDVSSLKTGNYFLKITSDKGSATEKFMKE